MAMHDYATASEAPEESMKKRLDVLSIIDAIAHEQDRVREVIGQLTSDLDPYLVPMHEKPEGRPISQDPPDLVSHVSSVLLAIRQQAEINVDLLISLRGRIK